jgi:hypothetical protein
MPEDDSTKQKDGQDAPGKLVKEPASASNPFYGCAILIIMVLTLGGSAFYMFVYTPLAQNKLIGTFTVEDAPPLPDPGVDATEREALQDKLGAFAIMAREGKPVTLTLSTDELNTLLVLAAEFDPKSDYRGQVLFTGLDPAAQSLKADLRWKMNHLPFVKAPDRYLAGQATFKPVIENNALDLHIDTIEVPGKTVDPNFVKQMQVIPWLNLIKLKDEVKQPLSRVTRFEISSNGSLLVLHCGETAPQ